MITKKLSAKYSIWLIVFGCISISKGQGWTFNFELAYSGYCPGAQNISLPQIPQNTFQNQAQCESVRQQILAISASNGTCTVYYKCTPCTGSDIINPNQNVSGQTSFNYNAEGKPIFTPHNSKAFEDWATSYKQQLESYGIKSILGQSITPNFNFPTSGNNKLDKGYTKDAGSFKPKTEPKKAEKKPDDITNKTIPLMGGTPLTQEERERQNIKKLLGDKYKGYLDNADIMSVQDRQLKEEAHPIVEDYRYIGVTVSGWLDPPASYVGIAATDIIAEDTKAYLDFKEGKPVSTEWNSVITKGLDQASKDIDAQLPGNIFDTGSEKVISTVGGEGFSNHVSGTTKVIGAGKDLFENNGIIDRSKRIYKYHKDQIIDYMNKKPD